MKCSTYVFLCRKVVISSANEALEDDIESAYLPTNTAWMKAEFFQDYLNDDSALEQRNQQYKLASVRDMGSDPHLNIGQFEEHWLMNVWQAFSNSSEFKSKLAINFRLENSSKSNNGEMLTSFR